VNTSTSASPSARALGPSIALSSSKPMAGQDVYVVGGANSAGQAALHLAKFAAQVTLLVRGDR
jgi:thioredoxin reductase